MGNQPGLCKVDGGFEAVYAGFSGQEYVKTNSARNAGITWSVRSAQSGFFNIEFRYANGTGSDRTALLLVDSQVVAQMRFAPTGGWDQWQLAMGDVGLEAGDNRIELIAAGPSGVAHIDYLRVEGHNLAAGDCAVTATVGEQIWRGDYRQGLPGCNICHIGVGATSVQHLRNTFDRSRTMQAFRVLTDDEIRSLVDYLAEL